MVISHYYYHYYLLLLSFQWGFFLINKKKITTFLLLLLQKKSQPSSLSRTCLSLTLSLILSLARWPRHNLPSTTRPKSRSHRFSLCLTNISLFSYQPSSSIDRSMFDAFATVKLEVGSSGWNLVSLVTSHCLIRKISNTH